MSPAWGLMSADAFYVLILSAHNAKGIPRQYSLSPEKLPESLRRLIKGRHK